MKKLWQDIKDFFSFKTTPQGERKKRNITAILALILFIGSKLPITPEWLKPILEYAGTLLTGGAIAYHGHKT